MSSKAATKTAPAAAAKTTAAPAKATAAPAKTASSAKTAPAATQQKTTQANKAAPAAPKTATSGSGIYVKDLEMMKHHSYAELRHEFAKHGQVSNMRIKRTARKGPYVLCWYADAAGAAAAKKAFPGAEFVHSAKPTTKRIERATSIQISPIQAPSRRSSAHKARLAAFKTRFGTAAKIRLLRGTRTFHDRAIIYFSTVDEARNALTEVNKLGDKGLEAAGHKGAVKATSSMRTKKSDQKRFVEPLKRKTAEVAAAKVAKEEQAARKLAAKEAAKTAKTSKKTAVTTAKPADKTKTAASPAKTSTTASPASQTAAKGAQATSAKGAQASPAKGTQASPAQGTQSSPAKGAQAAQPAQASPKTASAKTESKTAPATASKDAKATSATSAKTETKQPSAATTAAPKKEAKGPGPVGASSAPKKETNDKKTESTPKPAADVKNASRSVKAETKPASKKQ